MPLVAPLISGHSDVAIGSRLAASSRVVRGPKREFVSRSYNLILRGVLGRPLLGCTVRVQGGPRRRGAPAAAAGRRHRLVLRHRAAGDRRARRTANPRGAGRLGRRSRFPVDIVRTAIDDLKGCWRVGRALATGALPSRTAGEPRPRTAGAGRSPRMAGQLVRFAIVGMKTVRRGETRREPSVRHGAPPRETGPATHKPAIRPARERRDAAFDLARIAHADRAT